MLQRDEMRAELFGISGDEIFLNIRKSRYRLPIIANGSVLYFDKH